MKPFKALKCLRSNSLLIILFAFSHVSCTTVGGFYTKPTPASYYVNRYCFEKNQDKVSDMIESILLQYNFPLLASQKKQGSFETKPVHMPRLSRKPQWGYTVALSIRTQEHKGKISLKGIPTWAFHEQTLPIPQRPTSNGPLFLQKVKQYREKLRSLITGQEKAVQLLKHWEGCNIHTSQIRTIVQIKTIFQRYPTTTFGTLVKKSKGVQAMSDNSFEYSFLRVIAKRLGLIRHMRGLLR